ncbi:MAG: hypothetical protein ACQESO_07560, partial [Bacillota bacterium]
TIIIAFIFLLSLSCVILYCDLLLKKSELLIAFFFQYAIFYLIFFWIDTQRRGALENMAQEKTRKQLKRQRKKRRRAKKRKRLKGRT